MNKKNRILMVFGLLMVQTIVLSETVDARAEEDFAFEGSDLRLPGHHFTGTETFDKSVQFKDNVIMDENLRVKGKTDLVGRVIAFDTLHVKENAHFDGVLHVDQNIDALRNIICYGNIEADNNVNVGHDLHVDNSAHIKNNLTVDGNLYANNLVFTLSSTIVPDFSVCDLTIGCGLNILPAATISIGGDMSIGGDLSVGNDVSIGGDLSVGGIASVNSIVVDDLSVCDLTIGCNLITDPAASVSIGGVVLIDGDVSIGGNVLIGGIAAFNSIFVDDLSAVSFTLTGFDFTGGSLSVAGAGSFAGSLIAGCDLSVGCNIDMNNTTSAAIGNINKGGLPFISNFGTSNTFVGASSGNFTTTGAGNTALGSSALPVNGVGSDNTAVGAQALIANTAGTNNIAVGFNAGSAIVLTSNNIEIGNVGLAADAGVIRIGTLGTHTSVFIQGINGAPFVGNPVLVDAAGQLGTTVSSRRYKENIEKVDRAWLLSKLSKIIPVSFSYKSDPTSTKTYGMIAEELAEVMPELVIRNKDGQPETIAYHLFTPLLIAMIQEIVKENKGLTARVNKLENEVLKNKNGNN